LNFKKFQITFVSGHKKDFIQRSQARIQEVKDAMLRQKHGERINYRQDSPSSSDVNILVEKKPVCQGML